jgi:hypothetical protein
MTMSIDDVLRTYQDEFNELRILCDIGKKLILIKPILTKEDQAELVDNYQKKNIHWLRNFIREKYNDNKTA